MKQTLLLFLLLAVRFSTTAQTPGTDLQRTITRLDSAFFAAYNSCDLATQERFYNEQIEFFHDRSGLDTSRTHILANTKAYICGKVTRELLPGSIEVSPIPGYGAAELGMHQFRNRAEPGAQPHPSRFLIIWKQDGDRWTITKVLSLH